MTSAAVDYENPAFVEYESLAPLPTQEIARRKSVDLKRNSYGRRCTTESLETFSSDTDSSDPSKIVEIGNLRFLNDNDMRDGQSSILGKGAFAIVRLARRRVPPQRNASMLSGLTSNSDIMESGRREDENINSVEKGAAKPSKNEGQLVAVKIFEKSLLQKCRTVERDKENQMQVRTALDKVEREIAVMKMIQHPNLVSLYDVIDTGSNRLYMVLEYLPLGEIMTNVRGTGMYKRRPGRNGEQTLPGVTQDGYFDEHHAALYFVDIMHGLAHLHTNHIVHRDLKPENILLDSRGFAKIGDFGVAHLFEDEMKSARRSSFDAELSESNIATHTEMKSARISQETALTMESMGSMGKLTKTEGTWAFWSPEMCAENSLFFSGYTCDIWAAGICLYIFATGKLPFYSEIPLALFDMIAAADIELDNLGLSDALVDMLKKVLKKDPISRAGVGDCLKHPFCNHARKERIKKLGEEVEKHEEVTDRHEDRRQSLSSTRSNSSLRVLAKSVRSQFSLMRRMLSGRGGSSQSIQKSPSGNDVDEREPCRKSRRMWSSQNQMSVDDGEGPRRKTLPSNFFRRKKDWK